MAAASLRQATSSPSVQEAPASSAKGNNYSSIKRSGLLLIFSTGTLPSNPPAGGFASPRNSASTISRSANSASSAPTFAAATTASTSTSASRKLSSKQNSAISAPITT